jgi:hypothetical protein
MLLSVLAHLTISFALGYIAVPLLNAGGIR